MLKQNLWTSRGLTNGAMGTVVDIVARRENSVPEVVLVEMDEYEGPHPFPGQPRVIPVPVHTATFGDSKAKRRTTIPITLAWGITIHKSQGQTYSRVVVNLGGRESAGLSYVALSRVRAFEGLALIGDASVARLMKTNNLRGAHAARRSVEERMRRLAFEDFQM